MLVTADFHVCLRFWLESVGKKQPHRVDPGGCPLTGRSGGVRTPSPRFWRPVLYQLSYTPMVHFSVPLVYLTTDDTTPAPTVRPPSRIAKRKPSSIAIGAIKVTVIAILSPGITISVPAGNSTEPVTSVVRK